MNIAKEIKFNIEKPFVLLVRKTETVNIFAVGLLENQVFAKHQTQQPALLIVLKGTVLFRVNSEEVRLTALDTYQVPIDTEHDVKGVDEENIFLLAKERQ